MRLEDRKKILHKLLENSEASTLSIAKSLKPVQSTVYRVIKRYKETLRIERSPVTGPKKGTYDKKLN